MTIDVRLIGAKIQLTIITLNYFIAPPLILRSHSLSPLLLMIRASSDGNRSHHRHPRRCRQPLNSVPLIDAHSRGGGDHEQEGIHTVKETKTMVKSWV